MLTTQPKNISRRLHDFWFNCVRLLNHVKVTLSKPFTRGMKSVISKLIGPLSCLSFVNVPHLLCDCFRAADSRVPPYYRGMQKHKKERKKRVQNRFTKHWTLYYSWIDNIWTQGHIVLPAATSAVLVHVDKLTSTLTVHVEVTFPTTFSMASMDLYHSWAVQTRGSW